MTHPGGGNAVNLAALWVPVMPETSHLGAEMREVGANMRRNLMEGFNSSGGSGGTSPENMGSSLGAKVMSGFAQKMASSDFGFITQALSKVNEQVDEKLASKLKTQLPESFRNASSAAQELEAAERKLHTTSSELHNLQQSMAQSREREATATKQYNELQRSGNGLTAEATTLYRQAAQERVNQAGASERVATLTRQEKEAEEERTAAHEKATGAVDEHTNKMNQFQAASARAVTQGAFLGTLLAGAVTIGFNMVTGAVEGFIHLGERVFEGVIEGAKELADKLVEIGEEYANLNVQTVLFSGESGAALGEMQEHVALIFSQLDVEGKNLGQTYAQLRAQLNLEPGPVLDSLATKITELQGRFSNLKAEDLGAIFRQFKIPAEDFNAALDTLVTNSSRAGEGLGDLSSALKGKVASTLAEAGVSLGNASWLLGELHKSGIPATDVITGLSTAMSKLTKSGMDFPTAMREIVKELLNATAAQQDEASATLFGGRRWTEVKGALEDLNEALNARADAHNGVADAAQAEIDATEMLHNKIEKLKHQIEGMMAPFGEAFLQGIEHALERVRTWFDANHTKIIAKLEQWGEKFIDMLPTIKEWAADFVEVMSVVAAALTIPTAQMMQLASSLLIMKGAFTLNRDDIDAGIQLFKDSGKLLTAGPGIIEGGKTFADKIRDMHIPTTQLKDDLKSAAEQAQELADAESSLNKQNEALGQTFAQIHPSGFQTPDGGLPGGAPGFGPRVIPAAMPANYSFPAYDGGGAVGNGGNAEGPMRSRILQLGNQFGLTATEVREIMGVGQHESHWTGPGYMGFGPEAKAAGFDFDHDPIGAVDQFFKQFMGRRAQEGNPNDPQAVANYIWHVVHNAADPNYGSELLRASGFERGGGVHGGEILAGLFSGMLGGMGMVTGGKGGIDDVLIRATAGEMVMNKSATEKFRPQLEAMNAAKGYNTGGVVGPGGKANDSDSGVLQVIWSDTETGAKVGEAAGFGWVGPGTSQPGYYGGDWGDHTGHVHTSFSRNPLTGEPYTQVKAGTDIRQGAAGFPPWVYQVGAQFGLDASTYPGHQEWGGINHGIDWWPKGKSDMSGRSYTHPDHAMLTNFATAVGSLGAGGSGGGGRGGGGYSGAGYGGGGMGGGGGFAVRPADFSGGDGGGGGGGWPGLTGGGPGGMFNPSNGLPGLPGQYGGYGQYGGETLDDQIAKRRAVEHAQDRVKDLQAQRDKINNEDIPKLEAQIREEQGKLPAMQDKGKIENLEREIKDKREQLDKINKRELPEAQEDIGTAERKRDEASMKTPSGLKGEKSPYFTEAQQLGRGLLSGIAEELGFPDVFGKPIWEFGAVKMGMKALGMGWEWLNGPLGGLFGGGGMGGKSVDPFGNSGSQFPIQTPDGGIDVHGGGGPDPHGPDVNLKILPHIAPHSAQPGPPSGTATGPRDPEGNMRPSWRSPADAPARPAGYFHYDNSITLNGVENSELVSAASNFQHSWGKNQMTANSPGMVPV